MKIIPFIILPLFALVFYSCKKDSAPDNTKTTLTPGKVKTYTEDITVAGVHSVTTYNLNYDAGDRIISMVSTSNPGDKFVYQYNSTTSFTLDIFNSNVLNIHEIFFLNSSSLVDSSFQYDNTRDTTTEKYLYNNANQLTRKKEYDYSTATGSVLYNTHSFTYDSDGNVISDTDDNSVTTFYYTDIAGSLSIYPLFASYYTKPHNLVKTTTQTSGLSTQIVNHTYTIDSQNRLSTDKVELVSTGDVVIKTYSYY